MEIYKNKRLRDLVAHNLSITADTTLTATSKLAREKGVEFLAVSEGGKVIGLCSVFKINERLSAHYGYEVFGNRQIQEFMVPNPNILTVGTDLHKILEGLFQRPKDHFYDDVILVEPGGELIGLIPMEAMIRLQNLLLLAKLKEWDLQRAKLARKNEQLESLTEELAATNQKLVEARNASELATRLKSEFLANMSHEIRTPMNGIVGVLELIANTDLTKDQLQLVKTADTSANSLLRIINDILDFSKIEADKLEINAEPFDLKEVVDSVILLYQKNAYKRGIYLRGESMRLPPLCEGDPVRVRQILSNLVNNAIKFTDKGGVVVSCKLVSEGDMECLLRIEVRDTGIGISASDQEKLFQAFVQADGSTSRNYGGTGLGLSISNRLAKLMGGKLTCESKKDVGTVFYLELPLRKAARTECRSPGPSELSTSGESTTQAFDGEEAAIPKDINVLVVEDMVINREVARRFLERLGCRTSFAINGEAAIESIRDGDFDLVFMDCQMPIMDGYEATRQIRGGVCGSGKGQVFICAMTANAINGDRERCLQAGMDAYIAKPVRLADFRSILAEWSYRNRNQLRQIAV